MLATTAGKLTTAYRAGFWALIVGVLAATLAVEHLGDVRWWALILAGPIGAGVAHVRVHVRLDGEGVKVRSAVWTRQRPWDRLTRVGVGEVLLFPGKYGSGATTPVLLFEDHLGVRLRAVATVRGWDKPWLSELVRRCEAAGLEIDEQVRTVATPR